MSDQLIPDSAVKAIQDSMKTEFIEVENEVYATRQVFLPPEAPQIETLQINTLTGIVDYIKSNLDGDPENGMAVQVVSYDCVKVIGGHFGRFKQRDEYVVARSEAVIGKTFTFGHFYDPESFNIALQSLFVETDEREQILRVVGNIKEETVKQAVDDGTSQTVVARAGVARVEEVEVPNPVTLQPYRTFREIEQPASVFILRMRQNGSGLPSCALFEADGGKWKLMAIERIKGFLSEQLESISIIA
jgi:hypothetical protein